MKRCLPEVEILGHIPGRQNKNSKCRSTLYKKVLFVFRNPNSVVCPGSRGMAQDLDRRRERERIKFPKC